MTNIKVSKVGNSKAVLEQSSARRDWMDQTYDKHAYKCFPVSLANTVGWSISFTEDIEFIYHSDVQMQPDNIEILKGKDICTNVRANNTISFDTGLIFRTDQNMTMLSIAPPNYFIEGVEPITTLMSTSFYKYPFPIAWRVFKKDEIIRIPAGQPVINLLPISLKALEEIGMVIEDYVEVEEEKEAKRKYGEKISALGQQGIYTNPYRNATDEEGFPIGEHEVKSLKLSTIDLSRTPNKKPPQN